MPKVSTRDGGCDSSVFRVQFQQTSLEFISDERHFPGSYNESFQGLDSTLVRSSYGGKKVESLVQYVVASLDSKKQAIVGE